jgi:polysaccharide export outer membrane protein
MVVKKLTELTIHCTRMIVFSSLFVCLACSSRPHFTPRSETLSQAQDEGMYLPSIEEDRTLFYAYERQQEERLWELVQRRSTSSFRDPNYLLGAGDELEVAVFDVPELNITTIIRQSGFISLPLLGAVRAGGMTEAALSDAIARRLRDFVHDPQVSVFISNYGSQKVSVIGAVQEPGRYALKKGANSVLELLSEAGGLSTAAGNFLNFIPAELSGVGASSANAGVRASFDYRKHAEAKQNRALEIALDRVLGTTGGVPLELPVKHGDMIIVPEAGAVQVDGEVKKSGTYILGKRMSLLGALAASGGITYGAKVDEVEVIRMIRGERVHLVVNLEQIATGQQKDVLLKDSDIVRVPSHSSRRMGQDTFETITRIINFGVGGTVNLAN